MNSNVHYLSRAKLLPTPKKVVFLVRKYKQLEV
jgi:hypothetical protein